MGNIMQQDAQADGYYDEDVLSDDEIDLSFLDKDEDDEKEK